MCTFRYRLVVRIPVSDAAGPSSILGTPSSRALGSASLVVTSLSDPNLDIPWFFSFLLALFFLLSCLKVLLLTAGPVPAVSLLIMYWAGFFP